MGTNNSKPDTQKTPGKTSESAKKYANTQTTERKTDPPRRIDSPRPSRQTVPAPWSPVLRSRPPKRGPDPGTKGTVAVSSSYKDPPRRIVSHANDVFRLLTAKSPERGIDIGTRGNGAQSSSHTGARRKSGFETTEIKSKKAMALVCAAIDFGTTYSGYAYTFMTDQDAIMTNRWSGSTEKTPTVVLMDPNKEFHTFGEEARTQYLELIKSGKHVEWFYFEKFKMKLFVKECPLHRDMEIEDILGKSMKAIDIFTAAIRYIRQHLIISINDKLRTDHVEIIEVTNVHWVLTVPAIWNDLSKHFMREAATKAGIPSEMLTLALEPEAASLFCKKELGLAKTSKGCRYMVLDLGGGTADITCHEEQDNGTLKEIHPPSGGDFGGTNVDNKFLSIVTSIIGAPTMKDFKCQHMDEYWEMVTDFEIKKRCFSGTGNVRCKFSHSLRLLFEKAVGMNFNETLKQWSNDKITFKKDKIIIPEKQMKEIFDDAVQQLVEMVRKLDGEVDNIEHIILVGGFSESPYLQRVMRKNFDNLLILPTEPSLAVLKGAVLYGNKSKAISSRVCQYTYGIARMIKFDPRVHHSTKMVKMGNFTFCDDAFNKHIEIGTVVSVDTAERAEYQEYFPSTENQNMAVLEVYKSKKRCPAFVDEDGCELVGYIKVDDINPQNDKWSKLLVRLIFGGTELIVEVKDDKNGSLVRGTVDFLG